MHAIYPANSTLRYLIALIISWCNRLQIMNLLTLQLYTTAPYFSTQAHLPQHPVSACTAVFWAMSPHSLAGRIKVSE
jgi:hypothetical protein